MVPSDGVLCLNVFVLVVMEHLHSPGPLHSQRKCAQILPWMVMRVPSPAHGFSAGGQAPH